jgi:hypothetical protein
MIVPFKTVCNAQSFPDHLSKSHNNLKASPFRTIEVLKGTIIEKWIWLTGRLGSGNCILNVYLPYHYKIKLRYNWEQLETTENSKRCSVCSRYFESEEAKR